ncbi:MAG: methyltransferase domain-containing protein [Solirubrobacteraceae bacterium]|nr:methyltransferase domain-containing protein [Solirubrobacteraceae bacterium]
MPSTALQRTLALIPDAPATPTVTDGYLDLVGPASDAPPTLAQRAMRSSLLPRVYERAWRPVAFTAFTGRTTGHEERRLLDRLALRDGDTVLDVACGPGNTTRRLHDAVGDGLVVGLDYSPTMLARAVRDTTSDAVAYVRADAHRLPFADGSFDAVACYGALYLVERPADVIAQMARVLRPGGRLAILTTCHRGPAPMRGMVGVTAGVSGLRVFGRDEVLRAFGDAGLQGVQREVSAFSQTVVGQRPVRSSATATAAR